MEVLPRLVPGTVFKTVEPYGNHVVGGFDSHAFPPFSRSNPSNLVDNVPIVQDPSICCFELPGVPFPDQMHL